MLVRGLVFLCLLRHILDSLLFIDSQEIRERYINSDFGKMILSGIIQSVEHFFNISAMLDRANPLFDSDYAFTKAYLLATAAEDGEETVEGTVKAVQGWVDCFERCKLAGTVFAGGVNDVGDIAGHPALEKAYQMGMEV